MCSSPSEKIKQQNDSYTQADTYRTTYYAQPQFIHNFSPLSFRLPTMPRLQTIV
jgi:hypothetical protein